MSRTALHLRRKLQVVHLSGLVELARVLIFRVRGLSVVSPALRELVTLCPIRSARSV